MWTIIELYSIEEGIGIAIGYSPTEGRESSDWGRRRKTSHWYTSQLPIHPQRCSKLVLLYPFISIYLAQILCRQQLESSRQSIKYSLLLWLRRLSCCINTWGWNIFHCMQQLLPMQSEYGKEKKKERYIFRATLQFPTHIQNIQLRGKQSEVRNHVHHGVLVRA